MIQRQKPGDEEVGRLRADSGAKALSVLQQIKLRNEMVALCLVDQRMAQMTGVQFLEQAMQIYWQTKWLLLTDVSAINRHLQKY